MNIEELRKNPPKTSDEWVKSGLSIITSSQDISAEEFLDLLYEKESLDSVRAILQDIMTKVRLIKTKTR